MKKILSGSELAKALERLIPANETHEAITWEMGNEALTLIQDNRAAILTGLRSLDLIGIPKEGWHPDEWLPRAATWHQERLNWSQEVESLRRHILELQGDVDSTTPGDGK